MISQVQRSLFGISKPSLHFFAWLYDRTVRLWCQQNSSNLNSLKVSESLQYVRDLCDEEQSFELQWTGYGHTAHIWDSCIVSLSKTIRGVYIATVIASVGEDSTVRIWDLENGNHISVLKGPVRRSLSS